MNRIWPAKTIISFFLAFISMFSFAVIPARSFTKLPETDSRSSTKLAENLSASITIFITNEERISSSFDVLLRINREEYIFFYLDGLSRTLDKIGSRSYAKLVKNLDRSWWGIDIWDEGVSDKLGINLTDSLRNFVINLRDYAENPEEEIRISELVDDVTSMDIVIKFDDSYSEPAEYTDFSEFIL